MLAVRSSERLRVWTEEVPGQVRADRLASWVEEGGWVRCGAVRCGSWRQGAAGLRLGLGGAPAFARACPGVLAFGSPQHCSARGVGLLRNL